MYINNESNIVSNIINRIDKKVALDQYKNNYLYELMRKYEDIDTVMLVKLIQEISRAKQVEEIETLECVKEYRRSTIESTMAKSIRYVLYFIITTFLYDKPWVFKSNNYNVNFA